MSVNKVILVGRLGADPELRYTQSGTPLASMRIATNRRFKANDGAMVDKTQWHTVKVWGKQAELCEKYLQKGREIFVEGRLETNMYESDGQKKYYTQVVAERVQFLGGKQSELESSEPPPEAPRFDDAEIPF